MGIIPLLIYLAEAFIQRKCYSHNYSYQLIVSQNFLTLKGLVSFLFVYPFIFKPFQLWKKKVAWLAFWHEYVSFSVARATEHGANDHKK